MGKFTVEVLQHITTMVELEAENIEEVKEIIKEEDFVNSANTVRVELYGIVQGIAEVLDEDGEVVYEDIEEKNFKSIG